MEHVIYKLTSPSGKVYIGRTQNFEDRMAQHKYEVKNSRKEYTLYKAIRKYGWENFTKEIIATAPSQEAAQLLEEALIKQFDSVKYGYNDTYIGSGGNVFKNQPEKLQTFRKKMSHVTAGEKNGMFGKQQTEEAKQKQREKAKGRFSLQWYIDKYGPEKGEEFYKQRSESLRNRKLARNERGTFIATK
jgi:group I intron endonuclease